MKAVGRRRIIPRQIYPFLHPNPPPPPFECNFKRNIPSVREFVTTSRAFVYPYLKCLTTLSFGEPSCPIVCSLLAFVIPYRKSQLVSSTLLFIPPQLAPFSVNVFALTPPPPFFVYALRAPAGGAPSERFGFTELLSKVSRGLGKE